jgi:hypothetical protein
MLLPLHLGALHPIEQLLMLVLAFGPFVLLGLVIWWRHKHPEDEEEASVDTHD